MLKKLLTIVTILICFAGISDIKAQPQLSRTYLDSIRNYEMQLVALADSMYAEPLADMRPLRCEHFVRALVKALKIPGSYAYPFDSLQQHINIIGPDDKRFRLFSWSVMVSDVTKRYYGAIQMNEQELKLYPLIDRTEELGKGAEDSVLAHGKWLGATYYRIVTTSAEGITYYNLLGLNSSGLLSNKKLIDPLFFTENGPVFGAPVFGVRSQNFPSSRICRFILEYKKEAQVSMNLDKEFGGIYFDKLISQSNDPGRKYTFIPSGEYDGLRWDGREWKYVQNLIPALELKDGEAPAPRPKSQQKEQ